MKRILKLLARLYPAEWLARYGAEYEALLEEGKPRVRDVFDVMRGAIKTQMTSWSFWRIVVPCALVGALAGILISFKMPVLYTSGTVLLMSSDPNFFGGSDRGEVSSADVESQAFRVGEIAGDVVRDKEAMADLIAKYDLYQSERAKMPLDDVIRKMQSATRIRRVSRSSLDDQISHMEKRMPWRDPQSIESARKFIRSGFSVEFEYPDPLVAQRVEAALLGLITGANLRYAQNAALTGRLRIPETISIVDPPSLSDKPNGMSRREDGGIGLVVGLVGGLITAVVVGWRRTLMVANG